MSDGLNLNNELFNEVLSAITKNDARGREDMLINLQYLVGIAGYFCADYPGPKAERDELLQHLSNLMQHICEDRITKRQPNLSVAANTPPLNSTAPATAKGKSIPTADPAVGIWQPD